VDICDLAERAVLRTPWLPPSFVLAISSSSSFSCFCWSWLSAGARVLSAAQNRLCRLFLCFAPHPLLTCLPRFLCRHQSDPVGCSCSASRNRWPDVSRSALSVCYFSLTPGSTSARYMSRVGFGSRVRLCPVASSSTASKS
jgi:hypothetical protein